MDLGTSAQGSDSRFAAYVEAITSALDHADRAAPFQSYCAGLLLPGERKSAEPMAARIHPARVRAAHQSLHHFVAKADWPDEAVLTAVRACVLPVIERRGPIRALILDDTGFPKKGKHSVGVARQYCGQLGKQDNCQVAVSLSVANEHAGLPIAWRLYLPREWADAPARRGAAGVPDDVVFQTKTQIALAQLRAARAAGIAAEVALLDDAGYGTDTDLRDGITKIGLPYVVGIQSSYGRRAWNRCRRSRGAGAAVRRARSGAAPSTSRSPPSNWHSACQTKPGGGSPGAKVPIPSSPHALPPCASARRIVITNVPRHAPRNAA